MISSTERYADATREQLLAVVSAADRCCDCLAEFPDTPGACAEYFDWLDRALAKCPGTRAWNYAQMPHGEPD